MIGMPSMPRVLERPAHQQRRRDRPAVVGERDAAGGLLFAELGQLLALRSDRHGADRIDARAARPRRPSSG